MGFWDTVGNVVKAPWDAITGDPGADAEAKRKQALYGQAGAAGNFAQAQQGQFRANQAQQQQNIYGLQQYANGNQSVSAEQLRQATANNQAQQMSMAAAAGGTPNAAAAARTAAIQSSRLGAGLAGQQAVAGIQERQSAQTGLANALSSYGNQALSATQGARGQAIQGYGAQDSGQPQQSWLSKYGPSILGAAAVASDRKLKTKIEEADDDATDMLDGLKAYTYRYKDEDKFGAGERLGIMAQDLEKAGLGHTVMDTPSGKMVNTAQLTTSNTAMLAAINKRLKKLESAS